MAQVRQKRGSLKTWKHSSKLLKLDIKDKFRTILPRGVSGEMSEATNE